MQIKGKLLGRSHDAGRLLIGFGDNLVVIPQMRTMEADRVDEVLLDVTPDGTYPGRPDLLCFRLIGGQPLYLLEEEVVEA